jgi:hypothetical protein
MLTILDKVNVDPLEQDTSHYFTVELSDFDYTLILSALISVQRL